MTNLDTARLVQCRLVDAAMLDQADPELYLDASEAIVGLLKHAHQLESIISNLRAELQHFRSIEAAY